MGKEPSAAPEQLHNAAGRGAQLRVHLGALQEQVRGYGRAHEWQLQCGALLLRTLQTSMPGLSFPSLPWEDEACLDRRKGNDFQAARFLE